MLHDMIVAMGIYAKRSCLPESPLHDTIKDSMHLRPTRQAMDDIVRFVVQPCAIVDFLVCRFRSRQESKICYNPLVICNHKPSFTSDVRLDNLLRWITVDPLVHVTEACIISRAASITGMIAGMSSYVASRIVMLISIVCLFVCRSRAEGWYASAGSSTDTIPPVSNQQNMHLCRKAVREW